MTELTFDDYCEMEPALIALKSIAMDLHRQYGENKKVDLDTLWYSRVDGRLGLKTVMMEFVGWMRTPQLDRGPWIASILHSPQAYSVCYQTLYDALHGKV